MLVWISLTPTDAAAFALSYNEPPETWNVSDTRRESRMGIGIRIENLRKVYDTPPPSAARGGGFSFMAQRSAGPKEKKEKRKKFEIVALDDISLEMRPGEVFGLLGPNGAGKSTTIGVLTTRTRPTSGRAFIGEFDVWKEQVKAKRLIGVVPQRPNLDFALTAREVLLFHGA